MDQHNRIIDLIAYAFALSSIAGLAAMLRAHPASERIPVRNYAIAILGSGAAGVIVFLLAFSRLHDDLFLLIGISGLAGVGGVTVIDFIIQSIIKRRITIEVGK